MKRFRFETTATMKEYNFKKWWIDGDLIPKFTIKAENLKEALAEYVEMVKNSHCVEISKTAIRNKKPMYQDTENGPIQMGYVITGKTEFRNDEKYCWTTQYIDLWVTIYELKNVFMEENEND